MPSLLNLIVPRYTSTIYSTYLNIFDIDLFFLSEEFIHVYIYIFLNAQSSKFQRGLEMYRIKHLKCSLN